MFGNAEAGGLSAYSGQEACREDGIFSGAGRLPGGIPGAGGLPRHRVTACMGLCRLVERQCGRQVFRTPGQGACREDGICSGAGRLPSEFPCSGRTSPAQGHSLYGAVLPGRKAVRLMDFPHPGAGVYREDGISSGAGTLSGGFPGSGRIPRYMGNAAPKQIPPPHRPGRAAGVFSCMGTGRIRLRHRATWRQWGSRERRLPKPGRQ